MKHKFVEYIPAEIEEGILYISIEYDVAKHKCPCGCGTDIVTSLSPTRWKLTYDGETVSLWSSIGNWTHPCKSHYFIKNDNVVWAKRFSNYEMQEVIDLDLKENKEYYKKENLIRTFIKSIFNKKEQ